VEQKLVFLATLPQSRSALQFGEEARVQLNVSGTEIPKMVGLVALQGTVLRVTVEVASATEVHDAHMEDLQARVKNMPYD
jgi:hypothetical protein